MICIIVYSRDRSHQQVCKTVQTSRRKTKRLGVSSLEFRRNLPATSRRKYFFQMAEIRPADDGGNTCSGCCDAGGYRHPLFDKTPSQIKEIFENMPNFPLRDNDYLLCSFPKTGNAFVLVFFFFFFQINPVFFIKYC